MTTVESRTISVRINRPIDAVYEFLVNPQNWNQWATGLGHSLRRANESSSWIADSPGSSGETLQVQFTPRNSFGIVDHTVIRSSGEHVYVPMRLIANGNGCELFFTLFREPKMTDTEYSTDAGWVQRDLNGLKELMEK